MRCTSVATRARCSVNEKNSTRKLSADHIRIWQHATLPMNPVDCRMILAIKYNKIADAVVTRLSVDMMNVLSLNQIATEDFERDPAVLPDGLPINQQRYISLALGNAFSEVGTRFRTGPNFADQRCLNCKLCSALRATDFDLDTATWIVMPETLHHSLGGGDIPRSASACGAGLRAKSDGQSAAGGSRELGATELAKFEKRHQYLAGTHGNFRNIPHWDFDITPEMRRAVQSEGLALFEERRPLGRWGRLRRGR